MRLRQFTASWIAIVGSVMIPAVSPAAIIFYTDSASFNAAQPGLPVESFLNANLYNQPYGVQSSPVSSATNSGVFSTGSILPGLTISNLPAVSLPYYGLIVEGGGHGFVNGVGDNYFGDTLVLSFAPGVSAVGTKVFANTSPGNNLAGNFTEQVFNGSTLLGSKNFSEAAAGSAYIGVSSTSPITSVQLLYTTDDATTFATTIAFGAAAGTGTGMGTSTAPEPSSWVLVAVGALLCVSLRRFRSSQAEPPSQD